MDQQVPSNGAGYFYHPGYFYPPEYYNYLPTLWPRHYQDMATANNWQNFPAEKPNNFMPVLNIPQSLNMPAAQLNNFNTANFNNMPPPQNNANLLNFFPNQNTNNEQFQQQFQSFFPQHTQQLNQQFGVPNLDQQNLGQFDGTVDSTDKVKRDLYNEFFDLDNNAMKKETNLLLPNAVAAAMHAQVPRVKSRRRRADGGSETDSISSNDSNRSDHSSAAVVDSIINMADIRRDEKGMSLNRLNADLLSPKLEGEGEKIYKCEFCNKKFSRSWNYQRHVLIHSGRKPHKCDVCGKAFVLAAHLKIHMRIHTGRFFQTFSFLMNFIVLFRNYYFHCPMNIGAGHLYRNILFWSKSFFDTTANL